ncbi:MAG TPA: hypothetical protein VMP41_14585 [Acidimicrobiales bacterium]|nr:hypothetical protein [Acidimicrobiales bacterium]
MAGAGAGAGAGAITWLETVGEDAVGAAVAPDADDGTGGVTAGMS